MSRTCSCSSTICCGKLSLILTALSRSLDSYSIRASLSTGSIASCGVMKPLLALYGSIFTSILLVKVVWGKISGHTCRASVSSSPLLTDSFRWNTIGGWNVYQTLVCIPGLGSPILPFPFVEFPTDPGISTSMSLRYLQAVLSFFQNARCITVGRSSPARSRVSAPPDLKECMVNAVCSLALCTCTLSAFVISGADMGVFPLMGAPVFGRREILGKSYPCVMFQPSAVPTAMYCSAALMGHVVIRLVSYPTVMR